MTSGVQSRELRIGEHDHLVLTFRLRKPSAADPLTASEREVAFAVLTGASNAEIARLRGRSVNTVANQLANVFRKLRVQSRLELCCALAAHPWERARNDDSHDAHRSAPIRALALQALSSPECQRVELGAPELCRGQWQVVDCFDCNDQRHLVVRRVGDGGCHLSNRQQEALIRRSRGAALKEIAIDLGVSVSTISRELSAAMRAIGATSHADLPRLLALAA